MQLAPETRKIIEALPDEGLRRVVVAPNEKFCRNIFHTTDERGCLLGIAYAFDFSAAAALCQELVVPAIDGVETPMGRVAFPAFDRPFIQAENRNERDTFLNEVKAYCGRVLETRAEALRAAVERDLASVTVIEEPRGAVVGERVEA